MKVKIESEVAQLCLTLSNPMDCSLPGSSVHGIFQARVLEWGAIAFSVLLDREFKTIQFFVGVSAFSQIKEFRKQFHLLIFKCSQLKIICVSQLYILDSFNMYIHTHI